jgi:hypothetical protein
MGLLGSDDRAPDMSEVRLWRIAWHHHANAAGLQAADPSRAANRPWAYQQAWASVNLPEVPVRLPKYGETGCRTIGDWWTTLLNAYGNPIKYYGNEDLVLKQNGCSHAGPLEELFV